MAEPCGDPVPDLHSNNQVKSWYLIVLLKRDRVISCPKSFLQSNFIFENFNKTCLKGKYYHELFCNWLLWPTIKHLGSWIGQEIMLGFQKNGLQRGRVSRTIFWTFRLKKHDFSLKVVNYDLYLFRKVAWLDIQLQNWAQPALVPAFTSRGFEV